MVATEKIIGRKSDVVQDQLRPITVIDESDPIFDSESEDENCFYSVMDVVVGADEYRQDLNKQVAYSVVSKAADCKLACKDSSEKISSILAEYDRSGEKHELCEGIKELEGSGSLDTFVVKAVRTSLDKSTAQQLDMSGLLTLLYSRKLLTTQHISRAFEKLVQSVEDTKLDVPDVAVRLLTFIECGVDDGCLAEDFFLRLPEGFLQACADAEKNGDQQSEEEVQNKPSPTVEKRQKLANELHDYKDKIRAYKTDFFNTRDTDEVVQFLEEIGRPHFQHEFVRLIVEASLEKTDHHREAVSNALDVLYGKLLKPHDIQLGLARLIGSVEDLQLDTPDVVELLSKYLARSIVDEILPPSFLVDNYRLHLGGVVGMTILKKTQKWFSHSKGKARTVQFRKVWTGSDPSTREAREFKHEIRECIVEYLDSRDAGEASRLIAGMELTPDQVWETVRKVITYSMERGVKGCLADEAIRLLSSLMDRSEIDTDDVIKGFDQTRNLLLEITLDVPDVAGQLAKYVAKAKEHKLLPDTYSYDGLAPSPPSSSSASKTKASSVSK